MEIRCVVRCDDALGEGPLWDADRGRLYWVDIGSKLIRWLEPDSTATGYWQMQMRVTALALRNDGTFLLASDIGMATFDPHDETVIVRLHPEPDRRRNRPNDGHADVNGRFWFGTMDDSELETTGALYRLDPDWTCNRILDGLGIPNTVLCSADGTRFYLADSKRRELDCFSVDASGNLHSRRAFARLAPGQGAPDGSALDEHGYLWNAQWGASRLVRYAPDGRVDRIVDLPVQQPTSCAFGGKDLSTLFITSARKGLSKAAVEAQPFAGSLLAVTPGVRGAATPSFGG